MYKQFRDFHLITFLNWFDKQSSKPLDSALHSYFRSHPSLGSHDRRAIGDDVYLLMRWKASLEFILGKESSWETRLNSFRSSDFKQIQQNSSLPIWVRCGSTPWLFEKLVSLFGEKKAFSLSSILNDSAPLTIRTNLLKTTREELLNLKELMGKAKPTSLSPTGIQFEERTFLLNSDAFKQGLFEIQDEGSQLVAQKVAARPKDKVMDFCSGSGGKSLAIAPYLQGKGQIYLHDIRPFILQEAKKRLCRAGIQNAQCLPPAHPTLARLKEKMDWVLADVPCSGSGTYRRNPDMKGKIDGQTLQDLQLKQQNIAKEALSFVRPGGHFVYATCSLFADENFTQVEFLLRNFPLTLIDSPLALLPTSGGPDGFFAAVFCKK